MESVNVAGKNEQHNKPIVVVKVGSATLADRDGRLDKAYLADFARQIHVVRERGFNVVLVSSGAVSCGLDELGLPLTRPKDIPTVQAAASVGQRVLSAAYDEAFSAYGITTSLVLLTRRDTAHRRAYLHARDTFNRLLDLGVVPIVNENDTVSLEEIRFGDNDSLAALVACLIQANRVIILSDIDGLYTANPASNPHATLIPRVDGITPEIMDSAQGPGSKVGSGGMITKIRAARVLYSAGIEMVVCHGRTSHAIERASQEIPDIGTFFAASQVPHEITQKKLWIALGDSPHGSLNIDAGALAALTTKGSSLLAVGITQVQGDFVVGDVVDVLNDAQRVVARGIVRIGAHDLRKNLDGLVIHRDELVVFD